MLHSLINIKKTKDDFIDWKDQQNIEYTKLMLIPEMDDYSFTNFLTFIIKREDMLINRLAEVLKNRYLI